MPQHFLLTAQVRSMSRRQIFALSDDAAFDFFKKSRRGKGDEVTCPKCGSVAKPDGLLAPLPSLSAAGYSARRWPAPSRRPR